MRMPFPNYAQDMLVRMGKLSWVWACHLCNKVTFCLGSAVMFISLYVDEKGENTPFNFYIWINTVRKKCVQKTWKYLGVRKRGSTKRENVHGNDVLIRRDMERLYAILCAGMTDYITSTVRIGLYL